MEKKAVSPLISWILLVAFVIAIGAFIINWSVNFTKLIDPEKGNREDIYCDNVQLAVLNSCRIDNKHVLLNLSNKGVYNISILTLTRDVEQLPIGSCLLLDKNIAPKSTSKSPNFEYTFNIGTNLSSGALDECDSAIPINTNPGNVNQLTIVPWIIINNDKIACNDRKISVNIDDLNFRPCPP